MKPLLWLNLKPRHAYRLLPVLVKVVVCPGNNAGTSEYRFLWQPETMLGMHTCTLILAVFAGGGAPICCSASW